MYLLPWQVGHCLLPLLAIPLTFLLIPDKLMTDSFDDPDGSGDSDGPPGPASGAEPAISAGMFDDGPGGYKSL